MGADSLAPVVGPACRVGVVGIVGIVVVLVAGCAPAPDRSSELTVGAPATAATPTTPPAAGPTPAGAAPAGPRPGTPTPEPTEPAESSAPSESSEPADSTEPTAPTAPADSPAGGPGCGFPAAAFCADFEGARNTTGNRNGDLSVIDFSVSRWHSAMDTAPGYVGPAAIPTCRAGAPSDPLPPGDVLVCDPSRSIQSHYALIATAEQNYGDTAVRINRPFDIADRTGTIRFDTNLQIDNMLLGFPTLVFSADPYSAPSYIADNSGGATPREGLIVQFYGQCAVDGEFSVAPVVRTYSSHAESTLSDTGGSCPGTAIGDGRLNRVEVRVSQSRLEIWASDASADGVDFPPVERVFTAPLDLSFTQGSVTFGVHNHATMKYGGLASWTTLWDNVGFDGPVIAAQRVAQVADAAVPDGDGIDLGHPLPPGGATRPLALPDVSTGGARGARLVFNLHADVITNASSLASWRVNYQLNGGDWHAIALTDDELALAPGRAGTYSFSVPIALAELVDGTNTIRFSGTGFDAGYPPFVGNVDLVVQ